MPSPSTLHFWRLNETIAGSGYPSEQHYLADLTAIYRQEIADLYDLGCRYIQLDEVPLIMLANPAIRKRVVSLGGDPERLTAREIIRYPSNDLLILGTVAIEVGGEIWVGGIAGGTRIARFTLR